MNKPNLFIAGAPKCGTTFLYEFLKTSNQIYLPKVKELNFFSYNELVEESYYRDLKIGQLSQYLHQFEKVPNETKYLVDASVSYFASDAASSAIKQFNADTRIILMLRDPVKRAFSHFLMDRRMSHASQSLADYLKDTGSYHYKQYVGNSSYEKNVGRFINTFGEQNVLIIKLEELKDAVPKLEKFLDLELSFRYEDLYNIVNQRKEATNIIGRFALKNRHITERIKQVIPSGIKKFVLKGIYQEAKAESMTLKERQQLEKILKKDIEFFHALP